MYVCIDIGTVQNPFLLFLIALKEAFQRSRLIQDEMHTMISRLQNISQLADFTIRDVDIPLSGHKGEMGKLMQENWSHFIPSFRKFMLATKVMEQAELNELTSNLLEEFDEYETYQQFYSVVAKKNMRLSILT